MFYNNDYFSVPKENTVIAELYFRLNSDQMSHYKRVFSFMDFLGAIGGVSRILLQIVGVLIGSYSKFLASFSTIGMLYKIKSKDPIFDEKDH